MKNLILRIMKYGMRFLYFFMKLFTPVQDKVVFLSRQSDKPSENFRMLAQEFSEYAPHMTSQFYCKLGLKNSMGLGDIAMMLRQMKALAGARVCITESYCVPISILHHKPELKIIQIWHSMVAVKQFGWQTLDMPEGSSSAVANIMQMHEGYDSVVVGSDFMRPFFAEAMRMPLEKILPLGMPVADRILSERNRNHDDLLADFEKTYPHAVGKKRVVYLPTMRRGEAVDCAELVERFPYKEFALIIKLHPLDRDTEIFNTHVIIDTVFSTEQMITLADVVISDYSGAAAEAALLDKPVYFFTPDIVRYAKRCGLNVDPLTVFPHISFAMAEDLINAIGENRATAEDIALVRKYLCGGCDGHSTEKIVELAMQ
ncbi:MAG: CDP-glycerol glycerophosphotransferase family protein [Clostridia bacterium]|nr:CDP-glycerol glycerophosphotransferase family protein [Clostridia bacterium]